MAQGGRGEQSQARPRGQAAPAGPQSWGRTRESLREAGAGGGDFGSLSGERRGGGGTPTLDPEHKIGPAGHTPTEEGRRGTGAGEDMSSKVIPISQRQSHPQGHGLGYP